ncbi:MAG: pilus assembly protein N-terminal domain-containing protein [Deltaproteobacteria bacterium]|nr:pilus assembly protein N-terminal domain-containing protein [Deltaproteobacteria bacterium]
MKNFKFLFLTYVLIPSLPLALELPKEILLGKGEQETIQISNLTRVACSNSKVAQLRVLEPGNEILIQALDEGTTNLLVWTQDGKAKIPISIYSSTLSLQKMNLQKILESREGLSVSLSAHQIVIEGTYLRLEDKEFVEELIQKNKNTMTSATIHPKLLPLLKKEIDEWLGNNHFLYIKTNIHHSFFYFEGEVDTDEEAKHLNVYIESLKLPIKNLVRVGKTLRPMIEVDVKIIETSNGYQKQFGIDWPQSIKLFSLHDILSKTQSPSSPVSTDVFLDLLYQKGLAKIVSNPRLTVRSGDEARFHAGGEIPIKIISRITSQINWRSYGIILKVKPSLLSAQKIMTSVNAELSSLDASTTTDGIPGVLTRSVQTSLNIQSGESIVLSGLKDLSSGNSESGIPFLSEIPVLGGLFKTQASHRNQKELLILITPHLHQNTL